MITNLLQDLSKAGAGLLVAAATAVYAMPAQAATDVDLGELTNGVPTEYPGDFGKVSATFTVPEDGALRVVCTGTVLNGYEDAEHTKELESEFSYVNGVPMNVYQCKKGDVVYFYNSFVMQAGSITVTSGEIKLDMIGTIPSADETSAYYYGGEYSVSADYRVQFMFNLPVLVDGARLIANGNTLPLTADAATTTVEIDVATALMNMYKNGTLKKGDTIRLELYGVRDKNNAENKVNGDGITSVEFVMAAEPIQLVSTKNTPASGMPVMLSYYAPGNPSSLVQLTFSGDLSTEKTPVARLSYGDLDNVEAGMYYETIEGDVDGATVTFDLAGKLRRPKDMLPALEDELDYIGFVVANVFSTDGQNAYTGQLSNPYNFVYNYKLEVLQYNVVADFTPSASQGLEQGKELEIFIMEGNQINYDGVKFTYTAAGEPAEVVVAKENLDIAFEGTSDLVITLNVPALPGIDEGSEVTVTLDNMICNDGLDHSDAVTEVYKNFTSGIEGVASDIDTLTDVYNAQGIMVLKAANADAVRALPAGLYIAKGHKFIVK